MQIKFVIDDAILEDISPDLEELVNDQITAGNQVEKEFRTAKNGEKGFPDIVTLTFFVSLISPFISILQLWLADRPKYTLETEVDGVILKVENPNQFDAIAIYSDNADYADSELVKTMILKKNRTKN